MSGSHRAVSPKTLALLALLAVIGCGSDEVPMGPMLLPRVLSFSAPTPALEGSTLRVEVADMDLAGANPRLVIANREVPFESDDDGVVVTLDGGLFGTLFALEESGGQRQFSIRIRGDRAESEAFEASMRLAESLPIALTRFGDGSVFRNELAVLEGDGFLADGEGRVEAVFQGMFVGDGDPTAVDVTLPVALADARDRSRGTVVLTTAIGGMFPGRFEGTVRLQSRNSRGQQSQSDAQNVALDFQPPAIFALRPGEFALEQVALIEGGGFLGEGFGESGELTEVAINGTFTPPEGAAVTIDDVRGVPRFLSGSALAYSVAAEADGDRLVATLFGFSEGSFEGTLTPITSGPEGRLEGDPAPVSFDLTGARQVVHLRFLPGFYTTLSRFGLGGAAGRIEELVVGRMNTIYSRWNIDIRLRAGNDVSPAGLSIIDIGGPDPNGRGLFGYDNTPGKDIGNVRLFDRIGGENAETQADGYPGFGGVFVASFLSFSSHPGEGIAPGPEPDPLFDEIFDPLRQSPATLEELRGLGERATVVDRALRALANLIGETSAHELGHSLGMADPFGRPTVFHNAGDGDGCLMDTGNNRPLGERTAQPGFAETHLCGDNAEYLDEILSN